MLALANGEAEPRLARSVLLDTVLLQQIWGPPVAMLTTGERAVGFVSIMARTVLLCSGHLELFRLVSGY